MNIFNIEFWCSSSGGHFMKLVITDNLSFTDKYSGILDFDWLWSTAIDCCHGNSPWMTNCQWWQVSWNAPWFSADKHQLSLPFGIGPWGQFRPTKRWQAKQNTRSSLQVGIRRNVFPCNNFVSTILHFGIGSLFCTDKNSKCNVAIWNYKCVDKSY